MVGGIASDRADAPDGGRGSSAGVRLNRIRKEFVSRSGASVLALADVSLELKPSEFVSIVGPSGCGKSTLLRIVCGLTPATSGEVVFDGHSVTKPRADVGVVFQSPTLLPWLTVLENILMPRTLHGRLRASDRERASELISLAKLEGFENRYPHELSGGMRQRVGICRALIERPSFLAMDEPFGALDALTRESMSLSLMDIWSESGATVLFITHSVPEAILLSDRVVVMSPRPGAIDEVIDIELPRPRRLEHLGREDFNEYATRIRAKLGANALH